jgi:hypothetical protein
VPSDYLDELGSYGLRRLTQEPERLREEEGKLTEEIERLAVDHFRVHIRTQECVADVGTTAGKCGTGLASIIETLPRLGASFEAFRRKGAVLSGAHLQLRHTLSQHTELLELLEIPQLMDTCVRNNLFDEALELAAFANTLERRHGRHSRQSLAPETIGVLRTLRDVGGGAKGGEKGGNGAVDSPLSSSASPPSSSAGEASAGGVGAAVGKGLEAGAGEDRSGLDVIRDIVAAVRLSTETMRGLLIRVLSGPVQLTTCLRAIGQLKQLDQLTRKRSGPGGGSGGARHSGLSVDASTGGDATVSAARREEERRKERVGSAQRIRRLFLECRQRHHSTVLGAVPAGRAHQQLIRCMDIHRKHWFETITQ